MTSEERQARIAELRSPEWIISLRTQTRFAARLNTGFVNKEAGAFFEQQAKAAGINTHGKTHYSQLGSVTDPSAWISTATPIDDIKAACKRNGHGYGEWGSAPTVSPVKKDGPNPLDQPYVPAPDLVDEEIRYIRKDAPDAGATPSEEAELRREVTKKLAGTMGE